MEPEERAAAGVFLAMQYPVEIPGVANMYFLRQAINALRKARGEADIGAGEFMKRLRAKAEVVGVSEDLLKRDLNAGFSGGEKKRNEILQMAMLEPRLCILDETDSRPRHRRAAHRGRRRQRAARPERAACIVITHYQRLLDYIVPDQVHVLADGPHPALRRQGAGAGARGRRLCRRARRGARRAAGRSLRPWPPARTRGRAACPAFGAAFAEAAATSLPGPRPRGAGARACFARFVERGHPDRPGRGLEVHQRRQGGEPAAGAGAQGRGLGIDEIARYLAGGPKARRLIFVNGHIVPELSHVAEPAARRAGHEPAARAAGRSPTASRQTLAPRRGRPLVHRAERRLRRRGRLDRAGRRRRRRRAAAAPVPHRRPGRGVHDPPARSSSGSAPAPGCG